MDLSGPTIPLAGNLQGQDHLPLGWRGLSAGGALHDVTDQVGADGVGAADVRNRWHQDVAHGASLALCGCRTQSRLDSAAWQGDPGYLRRPWLFRRVVFA